MKNFLLLAMLNLMFFGCSKTDSTPDYDICGNYIADDAGIFEIFILTLNKDHSGTWKFYDEGVIQDQYQFTWKATAHTLTITDENGKTETGPYSISGNQLILGEVTYRRGPKELFTSLVNHCYVAANEGTITYHPIFEYYTFDTDSTIRVEQRDWEMNGTIISTRKGKYTIEGGNLKLKIQSIADCETCYNNFTASLSPDLKSFIYEYYNIAKGKSIPLFFYSIE